VLEELVGSGVGSKCQSSESIHDDVDPEKLNSRQDGSSWTEETAGNIGGNLELQEFAHGVVDAATPNNSLDD